jgi:glycosyltransferase involved in cell wall biosynthesis
MTYHTKFDVDIAHSFDSSIVIATAKKFIAANADACDEIWAVSQGAGENLKSLGYKGDFLVMENGIDFPNGPADAALIDEVSREHNLAPDVPVFLFVGRVMWYKNIKLSLESLFRAKNAGVQFKMIFIGEGDDAGEIMGLVNALDMEDECIFTGAVRDRDRLRAYFSRADMFLFPSTYDSAPLVVREAAACGLASILIRDSSSAEPTTDGVNAVLVDESIESLSETIISLAGNKDRMKSLGRRAAQDLYVSWDTAVARAYERYQVVLENHKKRS